MRSLRHYNHDTLVAKLCHQFLCTFLPWYKELPLLDAGPRYWMEPLSMPSIRHDTFLLTVEVVVVYVYVIVLPSVATMFRHRKLPRYDSYCNCWCNRN